MKYYNLKDTGLKISAIGLGTMRLPGLSQEDADAFVMHAIDNGINFIDEADIYGGGKSEEMIGKIFDAHPGLREKVILQSKAGIVPGKRYDASKEYIKEAVKASLARLHTDHLDIFLLHRPDALMDPKELAEAFDELHEEGLVHYFGVSNQTVGQMKLLQKYMKQPLLINQLQLSIIHSTMIDRGIYQDMYEDPAIDRDGDVINACMMEDILIQPWSPVQASWADGTFIGNPKYADLNKVLEDKAKLYNTSVSAIALAWLLRHPAHMQPIVGTTSIKHLDEAIASVDVPLTRQDWYDLYTGHGKMLP